MRGRWARLRAVPSVLALLLLASLGVLVACGGGSTSGPAAGHPLDDLATATIGVGGEAVEVWLARTDAEQTQG